MTLELTRFPLRLGFGCSGAWGMRWHDERAARAILDAAYEAGIRCFDTAGFYGAGEAERRLGRSLSAFREPVFVSTKTGTRFRQGFAPPLKDFSEAAIRGDVEASLKRLGRERIDLLYLHGPSRRELEAAAPIVSRLKSEGSIAAWGVCGEGRGLEDAIDAGADAIMGVYNVLRRDHAETFKRARQKGLMTAAIAPLAQGLYRRGFFQVSGPADLWRIARALVRNRAEWVAARRMAPALEAVAGTTPAGAALGFVLANPDIDVAITNSTSLARLAETVAAACRPPTAEALAGLMRRAP